MRRPLSRTRRGLGGAPFVTGWGADHVTVRPRGGDGLPPHRRPLLRPRVVVTSRSDARIPWPRGRALGRRGGPGLLVDEELARAVRYEAGVAVAYWFGVGHNTVTLWRRALGVPPRNEGSARLRALVNGEIVRGVRWPPERVERQSRAAREAGK